MKRIIAGIALAAELLLVLSLPVSAADTNTYILDELDMSVAFPSDLVVFTKDTKADDPNLAAYNLTKERLSSILANSGRYLDSWDDDVNFEIFITMDENPVEDSIDPLSDVYLTEFAESLKADYESIGINFIKLGIYQSSQTTFLKMYLNQPNGDATTYNIMCYTFYNGKDIYITLKSYIGRITSLHEATLKSIIDSVRFGAEPQVSEPQAPLSSEPAPAPPPAPVPTSGAFLYTDEKFGTTFTVPANWGIDESFVKMHGVDVSLICSETTACNIGYGVIDAYAEWTASQRERLPRSALNNYYYSKEYLAQRFGVSKEQVEVTSYGKTSYYKIESSYTQELNGFKLETPWTVVLRAENGYEYGFQFTGDRDSAYYDDFISLVESAQYPQTEAAVQDDSSSRQSSQGTQQGTTAALPSSQESVPQPGQTDFLDAFAQSASGWTGFRALGGVGNFSLSLFLTFLITCMPIILYRGLVRKTPVGKKTAWKITAIYGLAALFVICLVMLAFYGSWTAAATIVLWSFLNFAVLTVGKKKPSCAEFAAVPDAASGSPYRAPASVFAPAGYQPGQANGTAGSPATSALSGKVPADLSAQASDGDIVRFCDICGNRLHPGDLFCTRCGAKIQRP